MCIAKSKSDWLKSRQMVQYPRSYYHFVVSMLVLGIETSCDETAAAVVRDDGFVLSSIISSQIPLFAEIGGVVPEMAARAHTEKILVVIEEALKAAEVGWDDIDSMAVTGGPGLIGSLLIGHSAAQALSYTKNKPLVMVDHLRAHVLAVELWDSSTLNVEPSPCPLPSNGRGESAGGFHVETGPKMEFPAIGLLVSGGHTEILWMTDREHWEVVGSTIDDAAGEAFDKVGKLLGLPYPGGPNVSKAALSGDPRAIAFPRAMLEPGSLNFSFSGLKTAVLREVSAYNNTHPDIDENARSKFVCDVAASFQQAVVDVLVRKASMAVERFSREKSEVRSVILAGGVAANKALREAMQERFGELFRVPSLRYCTDNAAMVGWQG